MGIEATGKLHFIDETKQVSDKFTKREFVLELADNPKYPQLVQFQLSGDRCGQLDGLTVGDEVRVEFSLRGREWRSPKGEVKYFNSLDVWQLEPIGDRRQKSGGGAPNSVPAGTTVLPKGDDDIPFATCDMAHEPSPFAWFLR